MEWTTLPAQNQPCQRSGQVRSTQGRLGFESVAVKKKKKHTRLVVQEADGAVLVRGDGDGLSWVADHAVDELAACKVEDEKNKKKRAQLNWLQTFLRMLGELADCG